MTSTTDKALALETTTEKKDIAGTIIDEKDVSDKGSLSSSQDEQEKERLHKLEKRLLRKVDARMSILVLIYILNHVSEATYSLPAAH